MTKPGPTGKFSDDEGELGLAVGADRKNTLVKLDFGTPVRWVDLPPKHARAFAEMIINAADVIERKQG